MTIDAIRLTDLAEPVFSPEITDMRIAMTGMADDLDFDPDAMRTKAIAEVGLEDFGGKAY
jgi:hypothetical protein